MSEFEFFKNNLFEKVNEELDKKLEKDPKNINLLCNSAYISYSIKIY